MLPRPPQQPPSLTLVTEASPLPTEGILSAVGRTPGLSLPSAVNLSLSSVASQDEEAVSFTLHNISADTSALDSVCKLLELANLATEVAEKCLVPLQPVAADTAVPLAGVAVAGTAERVSDTHAGRHGFAVIAAAAACLARVFGSTLMGCLKRES